MSSVRGRYAPSPTGLLHLGNARTALLAWLQIRSLGGTFVMRVEDLDLDRNVPGRTEAMLRDLAWLGLDWDEGPFFQSERGALYDDALRRLCDDGRVYGCLCSRAEIAAASSAPHASDEGPRYPGTCRQPKASSSHVTDGSTGRRPALRFRVDEGATRWTDGVAGLQEHDVAAITGDFVVRRGDGIASYQLAVTVDDAAMGITHVMRGADLLSSTPRQLQLFEALGLRPPRYFHVPLLLTPDGQKLSKRSGDTSLEWYQQQGFAPQRLVSALARSAGLSCGDEVEPRDLIGGFDPARLYPEPRPFLL